MKKLPLVLPLTLAVIASATTNAAPILVADPSFELPALGDAVFVSAPNLASQGGDGWTYTPGFGVDSGIYNPPADTYATAGGQGTPAGADGAQAGYIVNTGIIQQTLAGVDGIAGNGDDPLFTGGTVFTLTVGVGHRLATSQYGTFTSAGFLLQIFAGNTLVGQSSGPDSALIPGIFLDQTLTVDSSQLAPALYGSPLSIRLSGSATTGVTDFDNVRLSAVTTPEPSVMALLAMAASLAGFARRRAADPKG